MAGYSKKAGYKPNCACNTGLKFQTFLAQLPEEGKANILQEIAQILDAFLGKLLSKNLGVVILFSTDFKAFQCIEISSLR